MLDKGQGADFHPAGRWGFGRAVVGIRGFGCFRAFRRRHGVQKRAGRFPAAPDVTQRDVRRPAVSRRGCRAGDPPGVPRVRRGVHGPQEHPGVEWRGVQRAQAAELAVDVADTLDPRNHLLPDVAALRVAHRAFVQTGLGGKRVFVEFGPPERHAEQDAQGFQGVVVEQRDAQRVQPRADFRGVRYVEEQVQPLPAVAPGPHQAHARAEVRRRRGVQLVLEIEHVEQAQRPGDILNLHVVRDDVAFQARGERFAQFDPGVEQQEIVPGVDEGVAVHLAFDRHHARVDRRARGWRRARRC